MNAKYLFLALSLLVSACRTVSTERPGGTADSLVGTWRLVSFSRTVLDTGETSDIFGKSPSGYISYDADGHMQVLLVKEGRTRPTDLAKLTDPERAELFKGMVAYAGTYAFDGTTVTHHIEVSWNQAWTGTDQKRDVKLEGDRITLTTHPAPSSSDGKMSVSRLVFERAQPPRSTRAMPARPTPVEVVQREGEAYNAQDIEAFVATYAENAVITTGPEKTVWIQGRQAIREAYSKMFAKYPSCRSRIAERKVEGNAVLEHEIITGRGPEHPDPWDAGWVRNVVEDGLIVRVELP